MARSAKLAVVVGVLVAVLAVIAIVRVIDDNDADSPSRFSTVATDYN